MNSDHDIDLNHAAKLLLMPERTVRKCIGSVSRPGGIKLATETRNGESYFRKQDIDDFLTDLKKPWPKPNAAKTKTGKPKRVKHAEHFIEALRFEVDLKCGLCGLSTVGELAHIIPWEECLHNHPWNLLFLCTSCHDGYDKENRIKRSEIERAKKRAQTNLLDSLKYSLSFERFLDYLISIKVVWNGTEVNGIDFLISCIVPKTQFCRIEKCRVMTLLQLVNSSDAESDHIRTVFTRLIEVTAAHVSGMRICEPYWSEIVESIYGYDLFPDIVFQLNPSGVELIQYMIDHADEYIDKSKYVFNAENGAAVIQTISRECQAASDYCDSRESMPSNRLDDLNR